MLTGNLDARATQVAGIDHFPRRLAGKIRAVVLLTQMSQKNHVQPRPGQLVEQTGAGAVRQVTVGAPDTFLEMPGIGPVAQHLLVMIRFDHQDAALAQPVGYQSGRDPQVSGHADLAGSRLYGEADGGSCIMGYRKGADLNVPEVDVIANVEFADIGDAAEAGQCFQCRFMGENRKVMPPRHGTESATMVLMFVGNEDGIQVVGLDTDKGQTPSKLPPGKPRVDQDATFIAFYVQSIALASAG